MLKELILSGLVIPFAMKKREAPPLLIDRAKAVDVEPVAPPMPISRAMGAKGDNWPEMTAIEAAKCFYLEMQLHAAGERLQWKWVRHSYNVLAAQRGWPALSDKALGTHLVSFGCKRKTIDLRRKGQGRTSAYEFPLETTAQKRRRKK